MVFKSQVVNGYPPLEDSVLTKYGLIWHDMLDVIPTERLHEYFKRAFQAKTDGHVFGAKDVIAAWNADAEEREQSAALRGERPPAGYSWDRDREGRFRKLGYRDEEGLLPFGQESAYLSGVKEQEAEAAYFARVAGA
jgi:hypothetical protein